jgi:hypothetical protein
MYAYNGSMLILILTDGTKFFQNNQAGLSKCAFLSKRVVFFCKYYTKSPEISIKKQGKCVLNVLKSINQTHDQRFGFRHKWM